MVKQGEVNVHSCGYGAQQNSDKDLNVEGQRRQVALPRQGINPDVTTEAGGIMGVQVNHIAERAPRRPSDAAVATA